MDATDGADCEARDDWGFAQDVNAWSSGGYVVVGVVLAVVVLRRPLPRVFLVLAGLLVLEGVGSLLYHGRGGDVAQLLHDGPLLGGLGFIAGWHVGRLAGPRAAGRAAALGALVGTAAGIVAGAASSAPLTNGLMVAGVAMVVGSEIWARRRGAAAVWQAPLLVLVALALVAWGFGRSDSPLCASSSWAQPHALWHLLSALVLLWWADRALDVSDADHAPRLGRRAVDRGVGLVAIGLTLAFHRSLDVIGRDRLPTDRPVLIVANHGNGFVDPIVVASVLRRLPRFLAKAALWKVVVARPFLGLAGVLPVYRSGDGDRTSDNRSVFAACHHELARGATVAIFPEGTTGDRAGLDRVRAGAARITLGALPEAPTVAIAPIGLAFESKVATRSRAVAMIGPPIDVARYASSPPDAEGEPARSDVGALTDAIRAALEDVSPGFATVDEREMLRAAARATLNAEGAHGAVAFGDVEMLARRLAATPAASRAAVVAAYRDYATRLQLIGITDDQLAPAATSRWRVAAAVAIVVAFGSVVVTATLIHLPALLLVVGATGAVRSTATKGTVRMLVGLIAGLATWIVAGMLIADGFGAVLAGAVVALEGAVALAVWTPLARAMAAVRGRLRVRDRVDLVRPVLAARSTLAAAVNEAAAS
jgi:glycerol-3-phosphate O-acyltransferase / dihydroxyacetone phosphate acyltransferase